MMLSTLFESLVDHYQNLYIKVITNKYTINNDNNSK